MFKKNIKTLTPRMVGNSDTGSNNLKSFYSPSFVKTIWSTTRSLDQAQFRGLTSFLFKPGVSHARK